MKIRAKLSWSYNILLIIGVITISAYAILSIRAYLLKDGKTRFINSAKAVQLAISNFNAGDSFLPNIKAAAEYTGYELAVYDSAGSRIAEYPGTEENNTFLNDILLQEIRRAAHIPVFTETEDPLKLIAYVNLDGVNNPARFLRISQFKSTFYVAIDSIRHIIYMGMIFSIGAVLIFSFIFARYMSHPILQLNEAALDIAGGNLDREINVNRKDEFGTLANSLNKMAGNLKADNEKLKSLNAKQNQFFADITHEIRNPLHAISGALEMLDIEELEPQKKQQYVQVAQKQIQRVVRLFEDIKSLQRYDFDSGFIRKEEFELEPVLREVVEVNRPFASEKGLNIGMNIIGNCRVYADPNKIEQVLDNLISNAVKYTNKGHIQVSCSDLDTEILVKVSDTGAGISEDHLEHLFDRFYRTDRSRSRDQGGTGLGLAVVKSILNAHGTDISVASEPGKGTSFSFKLPVSQVNYR